MIGLGIVLILIGLVVAWWGNNDPRAGSLARTVGVGLVILGAALLLWDVLDLDGELDDDDRAAVIGGPAAAALRWSEHLNTFMNARVDLARDMARRVLGR